MSGNKAVLYGTLRRSVPGARGGTLYKPPVVLQQSWVLDTFMGKDGQAWTVGMWD